MDGGENGRDGRADGAPGTGVAGVAGPPTAWPDGPPTDGPRPLGAAWRPAVPPPLPGPSRSRGRSILTALGVLAVMAAVAAAVVLADPFGGGLDESAASWRSDADPQDLEPSDDAPTEAPADRPGETTTTVPPPPTTAPPVRLTPPPTAPAEPGAHAFLAREDDGDPVTWDPCETIQYVVNNRTAPPGGPELVAEALAQVSAATGLVFEDMGTTDEVPISVGRPLTDPARYGEGWAPVLIAWTDPAEVAELDGMVGGQGAPIWEPEGGGEHESVTGLVHLDGPDVAGWLDQGLRTQAAHLVLHELGHMIGLDHVDDTSQVMYHNRDGKGEVDAAWNTGDLTGLAALGTGPCNPDI